MKDIDEKQEKRSRRGIRVKKRTAISMFLVLGVVLSLTAGAALVGYLSNTVETTITVSSPMEQWISDDGSTWVNDGSLTFNALGGETVTFYVKTINNANAPITGNGENIVTNTGITCADITSVKARTSTNGGAWTPLYDITSTCAAVSGHPNQRQFSYGPTPSITWAAGQVDITEISATFKGDAVGSYTFTSRIVP